jgi:hypothetical protein
VNGIKRRVLKLEKKRANGILKFCLLTLNEGDPDPPENQDPDVFRLIVDLRQGQAGQLKEKAAHGQF